MSQYHAPLAEMEFVLNELAGLEQVSQLPGFEEATPDVATAILEEASKFATNVLDPLNFSGDQEGAQLRSDGTVQTPAGFKDAYRQFCENGWMGLNKTAEYGGQGLPQLARDGGRGNVAFVEPRLRPVSDADARRDRGDRVARVRRAEADIPAEHGGRHVDRHDEPDRAAGGLRSRGGAHARGAAGRRHVQALRHQDLHHLRRARLHRQHHPSRARAHAGCAAGGQGDFAVRRAEVSGQWRRVAGRAQRRRLRVARAQARHPLEPDGGHVVRRQGRRDRLRGGRGESRPRIHVHHDEPRPVLRRHGRRRHFGARLSAGSRVREGSRAGQGPGPRAGGARPA